MPRPKRRLSANQEQSHHLSLTSTSSSSPSHLFTSLRPMDPQTHHHSPTAAAGQLPYPSSSSSDHSHSGPSGLIGRQIVNHREILDDVETNQSQTLPGGSGSSYRDSTPSPSHASMPTNTPHVSAQTTYTHRADLYTYNSLSSFSFGSAQAPSSSRPLVGDEDFLAPLDVTPRPSVVGPHNLNPSYRSHPAQFPGQPPGGPSPHRSPRRSRAAVYQSSNLETASRHTFGTSSASASVTSLSSTSPSNSASGSRAESRASRNTGSTSQNSGSNLTDDDSDDHHHPIPPRHNLHHQHAQHPPGPPSSAGAGMEFSSDEDYESEYDYDYDAGMEIEISSAMYEGSLLTDSAAEWERAVYGSANGSSGSVRAYGGERKGSLPMSIPSGGDGVGVDDGFFPIGRDREDSLATLRRPSRSLDDDLKTFGIGGASISGMSGGAGNAQGMDPSRPLLPAPVSVPESDGDWRSLQERSRAKGKAREGGNIYVNKTALPLPPPPLSAPALTGSTSSGTSRTLVGSAITSSSNTAHSTSAMEGFDLDWSSLQQGIVSLDQSQVADIIRVPDSRLPQAASGSGTAALPDARRPSAPRWLNMFGVGGDNSRRLSEATVSSAYGGDSFGRAVGKWGGDGYQAQRRDWSFRREKADRAGGLDAKNMAGSGRAGSSAGGGLSSPRESIVSGRSGMTAGEYVDGLERVKMKMKVKLEKERERERDNERERDVKVVTTAWKGMELDSQELWKNDLVGRFKVDRRATKPLDNSKAPQQRLVIQHFRDPYALINLPHNGPLVTIHKHSKAKAFSISRHYRPRPPTVLPTATSGDGAIGSQHRHSVSGLHDSSSSRSRASAVSPMRVSQPLRDGGNTQGVPSGAGGSTTAVSKKSSSMILLAPRRVQEAFTNTTTTRKLEAHGLLDERNELGGSGSRDREQEREQEKERERRRKAAEEKAKAKRKRQKKKDEKIGNHSSSAGSVAGTTSATSLTLAPPSPSLPPPRSAPASSSTSLGSHDGSSASHTSRRRRLRDPTDDTDDSDSPPLRTPHSEAYGTMDASLTEQLRPRHDRPHHASDFDSNAGLWKRVFWGRSTHLPGPSPSPMEAHYDPPWIVLASRNKQEQQQRVVDNLNSSFKDVGLLPSTHKDKSKHTHSSQKQKKIASGTSQEVDIFEEVPPDSLYMLLPLWPGDTDPVSERAEVSYRKPHIPSEKRQYLLVYYKPTADSANAEQERKSKTEGEGKKRSRGSPNSSHESKRDDGRGVLLSSFHISARPVSYKDLQGSGVRVPDEGLTVTGLLSAAFSTMPSSVRDEGLFDWVIGMCHSRETGIEFYPEGLVKMGLCLVTSAPPDIISEAEEPPEPVLELTPVGRAVLEMAWLGCMALTSFKLGA